MAKVEKITFKYERRFNLGDFNSLTLDIMPTLVLEPGDDLDQIMRETWEMCRKNIEHAARPIMRGKNGVTKQELFLGLPLEREEKEQNAD
jgi:hypothetical protein